MSSTHKRRLAARLSLFELLLKTLVAELSAGMPDGATELQKMRESVVGQLSQATSDPHEVVCVWERFFDDAEQLRMDVAHEKATLPPAPTAKERALAAPPL